MADDPRFARISSDPRFKPTPKHARKVKIDPRFRGMFTEKSFKTHYARDKRGRKVNQSSNDDLRRFYDLEEDEDNESPDESRIEKKKDRAKDTDIDYARGEGPSSSSSSEDEEEEEEKIEMEPGVLHSWGELDTNVDVGDEVTRRLAVCNMDWDRVTATDLFVLLSSFKPTGGVVTSVKIYPSEFGLERMSAEDRVGPAELVDDDSENSTPNNSEGASFSVEKLRQYQLNRLKYYYAVVECDSTTTASAIYETCDGMEYELSASRIDLRFVPDDMEFDHDPVSVAEDIPAGYKPPEFATSALQQTQVTLTWDETDYKRQKATTKNYTKEELKDIDFKEYLASSDDEDDDEENDDDDEDVGNETASTMSVQEKRALKYRSLLDTIEEKTETSEGMEMEVTWEPGLKEGVEELVQRKEAAAAGGGELTPWEQYLKTRKEKKKERKKSRKIADKATKSSETGEASGDDGGFDDAFFATKSQFTMLASAKTKKKKKRRDQANLTAEETKKRDELELLLMDDDEDAGKTHFNLKKLLASEKDKGSKKRSKKQDKMAPVAKDDFKMDLNDPRFDALFTSNQYAVDPSDPRFKATRGSKAIVVEGQRRKRQRDDDAGDVSGPAPRRVGGDASVAALVTSVKAKAASFRAAKARKSTH
ncbi:ESF1 homolog isoform X2 [Oscarella lobularis]|uniref:ESF1 homolog isoform X2 n=1 Tax=Oscarella lobularis TaxID=121494 RepID=UPI0033139B1E